MRIALDVMGGDNAPFSNINGALSYLEESNDLTTDILLVGDEAIIKNEIDRFPIKFPNIKIINTTEIVEMDEKPSRIFRTKPNSSLVKSVDLIKKDKADAVISAGNTGALLASSLFILGKIDGIIRPALAPFIPTENGSVVLCDVGANADAKPQHLVQFALMASAFLQVQKNIKSPKVALVNIGSEESKGNELTRTAFQLLNKYVDNFKGNIESRYLLNSDIDVAVCDGFTGNIILKLTEGIIKNITDYLKKELTFKNSQNKQLSVVLNNLKRKYDYEEYGGTPILGINGIVIKCHGSSSELSIKQAIITAKKFHDANLINDIADKISKYLELSSQNKSINETQTA